MSTAVLAFRSAFTNRSSLFFSFLFFARKAAVERDASEVSQKTEAARCARRPRAPCSNPVPWTRSTVLGVRVCVASCRSAYPIRACMQSKQVGRGGIGIQKREFLRNPGRFNFIITLCARTPSQIQVSNSNHTAGSEYVAKSIYVCVRMASPPGFVHKHVEKAG